MKAGRRRQIPTDGLRLIAKCVDQELLVSEIQAALKQTYGYEWNEATIYRQVKKMPTRRIKPWGRLWPKAPEGSAYLLALMDRDADEERISQNLTNRMVGFGGLPEDVAEWALKLRPALGPWRTDEGDVIPEGISRHWKVARQYAHQARIAKLLKPKEAFPPINTHDLDEWVMARPWESPQRLDKYIDRVKSGRSKLPWGLQDDPFSATFLTEFAVLDEAHQQKLIDEIIELKAGSLMALEQLAFVSDLAKKALRAMRKN